QFGHDRALGRGYARSRRRQIRVRRRGADDDPIRTALVGQPEIDLEDRARLRLDHIGGPHLPNRRLDVVARPSVYGLTGRRRVCRIQTNAGMLRVAWSERRRAWLIHYGFDNAGVERRATWLSVTTLHGIHGAEEINRRYYWRHQRDFFAHIIITS